MCVSLCRAKSFGASGDLGVMMLRTGWFSIWMGRRKCDFGSVCVCNGGSVSSPPLLAVTHSAQCFSLLSRALYLFLAEQRFIRPSCRPAHKMKHTCDAEHTLIYPHQDTTVCVHFVLFFFLHWYLSLMSFAVNHITCMIIISACEQTLEYGYNGLSWIWNEFFRL